MSQEFSISSQFCHLDIKLGINILCMLIPFVLFYFVYEVNFVLMKFALWMVYVKGKESVVKVVKTYENDRISEVLKLPELRGFQNHKGRNSSG